MISVKYGNCPLCGELIYKHLNSGTIIPSCNCNTKAWADKMAEQMLEEIYSRKLGDIDKDA